MEKEQMFEEYRKPSLMKLLRRIGEWEGKGNPKVYQAHKCVHLCMLGW